MATLLHQHSHHLGIFALPYDIVLQLFSHLDQHDHLTCMAVCHYWYDAVPRVKSQQAWKSIRLTRRDAYVSKYRRDRCLGVHVKNVKFDGIQNEEELYALMRKLPDWGCTEIESLEFDDCITDNQSVFTDLLRMVVPRVTHLKMVRHLSALFFPHLIAACPNLSHFVYQNPTIRAYQTFISTMNDQLSHISRLPLPPGPFHKMVYLCLDAMIDCELYVEPILQRSPNLRYFIGESGEYTSLTASRRDIYAKAYTLDDVVAHSIASRLGPLLSRWCPKLIHLKDHYTFFKLDDKVSDTDNYNNNDDDDEEQQQQEHGLRYLSVFEGIGQDHIGPALIRSQNTLEYFSMEMYPDAMLESDDWSGLFHTLSFPRLQALNLYNVDFDGTSIVTMLNQCPVLKNLTLKPQTPLSNPLSPLQQPLQLQTMQYVHTLHLDSFQPPDGLSLNALLESFPALEKLDLVDLSSMLNLPQLFGSFPHLQRLHIENVPWSYSDNDSNTPASNNGHNINSSNISIGSTTTTTTSSESIAATFFQLIPANQMKLKVFHLEQDLLMPEEIPTRSIPYYDALLLALANISTLKELHIDLKPDWYTDEGLLKFITIMGNLQRQQQQQLHQHQHQQQMTPGIESLMLRNVRSFSDSALFDAFAELSSLKTLAVLSRAMPTPTHVNLSGLITMLQKSKSLVFAAFDKVKLVSSAASSQENDGTFEHSMDHDLKVWIQQQLCSRYTITLEDYAISITLKF